MANKIKVIRRPQIRTGAAKKLTPLLKDAAEKRRGKGAGANSASPAIGGKLSRANSESGTSEAATTPLPNVGPKDYGTLSAQATNAGASTPRRRPTGPNRLGSVTSTGVAFDKVKVKGGNSLLRQQTLEAMKQNLEAIGSAVVEVQDDGGATSSANGKAANGSQDSQVTITATATLKDEGTNGDGETYADAQSIRQAQEDDENAPLLGGKQVAGSPGNY